MKPSPPVQVEAQDTDGRDRNPKRPRDLNEDRFDSSSERSGGGKGQNGKSQNGKGQNGRGKGKGQGGKGVPNSNTRNKKQERMANYILPQPPVIAALTKEQKLETPCSLGPKCQTVFKCGFQHTMKECAAENDRVKAEAKTEQERALQSLIKSYTLAEASPFLAHGLANHYPHPVWKFPAPKGFHNQLRTEEELFREDK